MAQNLGEEIGPHVSENRSLQNRLDELGDALDHSRPSARPRPAQTDSPDSSSSESAFLDEIIEHTEHVNRQRRLDEAIDQAEQQRPGQHPQQGENRRRTDENDGVSPQGRFSPTDPFDFLQRFFGRRTWREKIRGPNARQRLVDMLSDARRNVLSSRKDHRANSNYVELVIDREVLQRQDVHYLDVIARRERMVTPDRVAMTGRGLRRIESTSAVPSRQDYHSFVDRVFAAMVRKVRSRQLTVPLTSSEGVNVPPLGTVYIGTPRRSGLSLREMRRGTREAFNRFIRRYGRNTLNHGIESIEVYAMEGFLDEVQVDRLGRFTSEQ